MSEKVSSPRCLSFSQNRGVIASLLSLISELLRTVEQGHRLVMSFSAGAGEDTSRRYPGPHAEGGGPLEIRRIPRIAEGDGGRLGRRVTAWKGPGCRGRAVVPWAGILSGHPWYPHSTLHPSCTTTPWVHLPYITVPARSEACSVLRAVQSSGALGSDLPTQPGYGTFSLPGSH